MLGADDVGAWLGIQSCRPTVFHRSAWRSAPLKLTSKPCCDSSNVTACVVPTDEVLALAAFVPIAANRLGRAVDVQGLQAIRQTLRTASLRSRKDPPRHVHPHRGDVTYDGRPVVQSWHSVEKAEAELACRVTCRVPVGAIWLPVYCGTLHSLDVPTMVRGGMLVGSSVDSVVATMSSAQGVAWRRFARVALSTTRVSASLPPSMPSPSPDARLVILGGSMLAGANCVDTSVAPPQSPACAYPRRILHGLSSLSVSQVAQIDWVSLATGGMTTEGLLPSLPSMLDGLGGSASEARTPTLLLLDHSVNDAKELGLGAADFGACLEALLRYLAESHPHAAVLLVDSFVGQPTKRRPPKSLDGPFDRVAAHYGVPLLRYARVVSNITAGWDAGCVEGAIPPDGCMPHPWWGTHQLIADSALAALHLLSESLLRASPSIDAEHPLLGSPSSLQSSSPPSPVMPYPLSTREALRRFSVCAAPPSHYSAREASLHAFHSHSRSGGGVIAHGGGEMATSPSMPLPGSGGCWQLTEDRPGKPGWICESDHSTGAAGGTISFDLQFGDRPRASLTFLRGYANDLGEVQIRFRNVRTSDGNRRKGLGGPPLHVELGGVINNTAHVDARRTDGVRVTQSAVLTLFVSDARAQDYGQNEGKFPRHFQGIVGFGIPPFSRATLEVTAPRCPEDRRTARCKFKIIAVSSC
jgi:hypothetical protein